MDYRVESKSIDDLPPEILASIFSSYLESECQGKLCSVLAMISTRWQEVAPNPMFWIAASFTAEDFKNGCSWLKEANTLKGLFNVKTLHFSLEGFIPKPFSEAISLILENSSNLENFRYSGSSIPYSAANLPIMCPNVKEIQIEYVKNDMFYEYGLCTWVEKYNVNLTTLSLCNVFLSSFNLTVLLQKIARHCPNMTCLEISIVSCKEAIDLNALQTGCPKMKELSLSNVTFSDDDDDLTSCFPFLTKFYFKPYAHVFYRRHIRQHILRVLRGSEGLVELVVDVNLNMRTLLQLPYESLTKIRFQYYSILPSGLYITLCQWRHSLAHLDVSCDNKSQQFLFQYLGEYGKDTLESLCFHSFSIEVEKFKTIVWQCMKLNFLSFGEIQSSAENSRIFSTPKEIVEWLSH